MSKTIIEAPVVESADEIEKMIEELRVKQKKLDLDAEPEVAKVNYPIADVTLHIDRNMDVTRSFVTPPELMLLVAMHMVGSGGEPVKKLRLAKEVRADIQRQADAERLDMRKQWLAAKLDGIPDTVPIDPRALRNWMAGRYGAKRVHTLFPGAEPSMPTTFRRALSLGTEVKVEESRLLEMQAFGGE